MAYTDAQGRPELIAGDFLKKSTGTANTSEDRNGRSGSDTQSKDERKPVGDR